MDGLRPRAQGLLDMMIEGFRNQGQEVITPFNMSPVDRQRTPLQQAMNRPEVMLSQPGGQSMVTFDRGRTFDASPVPQVQAAVQSAAQPMSANAATGSLNIPQVVERQQTPDEMALNMPRVPGSDMDIMAAVKESEALQDIGKKASQAFQIESSNKELKSDPTFQERIKGFFGDRENMLSLALAFNSMRLEPDQALATTIGAELKDLRAKRSSTQSANRTVSALRAIGTKEASQAADMIEANPTLAKEIYGEYVKKSMEGPTKEREAESALRKEYVANPTIKRFSDQSSAFGRMVASATEASPAGDLALIYNFMKLLDPGSTVMQGEFENTARAGGYGERIQGFVESISKGTTLTPSQRSDFLNRARDLYQTSSSDFNRAREQYISIAGEYNFDVDRTVPDFYSANEGIVNPKITYDQLPPATKRRFATAEEWNAHFNGLTYLQQLDLRAKLK